MSSLTWDDVRSRRLARSHLLERAPADRLAEVVRDVCGIHAPQVMGSAELAVAPARKLTRAERAGVEAEAERIGSFLGLEPKLSIS